MALDVILARRRGALCMGDATDAVAALSGSRFHLVVFCAKEFGPPPQVFKDPRERRAKVYYCPLDDAVITKDEAFLASRAADVVLQALRSSQEVLVTCMQGRNRSGLVIALALHMLSGSGGEAAAQFVRQRRLRVAAPALTNPSFVALLKNIPLREDGPKVASRAEQKGLIVL